MRLNNFLSENKILRIKGRLIQKSTEFWKKDTKKDRAESKLLFIAARDIDERYGNSFYNQRYYEEVEDELGIKRKRAEEKGRKKFKKGRKKFKR